MHSRKYYRVEMRRSVNVVVYSWVGIRLNLRRCTMVFPLQDSYIQDKISRNNTAKSRSCTYFNQTIGNRYTYRQQSKETYSLEISTEEAAKVMQTLNYMPSVIMREYDVSACTDVTGFGVLGSWSGVYQ